MSSIVKVDCNEIIEMLNLDTSCCPYCHDKILDGNEAKVITIDEEDYNVCCETARHFNKLKTV